MPILSRVRNLIPRQLLDTSRFAYVSLPSNDQSRNGSPTTYSRFKWQAGDRLRIGRMSVSRSVALAIAGLVFLLLFAIGGMRGLRRQQLADELPQPFYWELYDRLNGYYNGVSMLVPVSEHVVENQYNQSHPPTEWNMRVIKQPPINPVPYSPYPDFTSREYLKQHHSVETCYLDAKEKVPAPDVYAYPALPKIFPEPLFGSYEELGIREDVCFDRFGRLGPYGYGYNESVPGALGVGDRSENAGSEQVFAKAGFTDYSKVDWGAAQKRCGEKNKARFAENQPSGKKRVRRQAFVLRTWTGYKYNAYQMLSLRAMVNELSLKSGGEFDVHFLVHVKNNSIPIWADKTLYQQTLEENVPREFWNLSTLWSEQQMLAYYPAPFPDNFANMAGSSIHGVYRSAHFPLQWFSQEHPEYDFVWNWEMDVRYSGHYYEFHTKVGEWAARQPRKGLWERSARFWMPNHHGNYANFTAFVEAEVQSKDIPENDAEKNGPVPVWGPARNFTNRGMLPPPPGTTPPSTYEEDNYTWGVGEEADLLTFNPIFDPSMTNWVFSQDVTGYNRTLPIPPRRAAIVTVGRLSKRLLSVMHEETWRMKHHMFPEMFPAAMSFHHGLKAAYIPHPIYFDRDWETGYMDQVFNYPKEIWSSPFGWGENNLLGSTFYYNAGFSGALWRRWLGMAENGEGGRKWEEEGSGRMCLRGVLHHPVKREDGPVD
ncbi:hypothetical protein LTR95_006943 [Oleoguttula sp. CCFEE 5521]